MKNRRTKSWTKILIMLLMLVLFAGVLAGCSERDPIEGGISGGSGDSNITYINKSVVDSAVIAASENRKKLYKTDGTEEWFVIDLVLDFDYSNYTTGGKQTSKFTLILKANWSAVDNNQSELMFRIVDPLTGIDVIGVYYLERTMYVTLMGDEDSSYRFNEVNFTSIAQLLMPLLGNLGIDPAVLLMSVLSGNTRVDIKGLLDKLGLEIEIGLDIFAILDSSVGQGILFDTVKGKSTYQLEDNGNTEIVGAAVKANSLLDLLNNLSSLKPIISTIPSEISWDVFGLPDFDPILEQFLGFSLKKLKEKDWPKMDAYLRAVNRKMDIPGVEGKQFVLDGFQLNVDCEKTAKYPNGEYEVDIRISPFFFGNRKEKASISFAGLGLTSDNTKYSEGGLLNLDLEFGFEFDAPENTKLTVGDITGTLLNGLLPNNGLDALNNVPITFDGSNYVDENGEKWTKYEFDIEIKTDLDFFNGENNRAEINLKCANGQGGLRTFLSVYLVGTTLYVYTEEMGSDMFALPNISIPNIDLTAMLFGEGGALGVIMPFIDPDYVAPPKDNGGAASNASSAVEPPVDGNGNLDVMKLLKLIMTYKSYYNWKGELIENEEGNITLPGSDRSKPLIIELKKETLDAIIGGFVPEGTLGIERVAIETYLSSPLTTTRILIELPQGVKAQIGLKKLGWLATPQFDFTNVNDKKYDEVGKEADFFISLEGQFELGIKPEDEAARVVLNLGDLIQNFAMNLLLDIGISTVGDAKTTIGYLLKGNFNMKEATALDNTTYTSFRDTSFALYLFVNDIGKEGDHFLMVYYNGTDDMLYIDLSRLHILQEKIPLFKIVKPVQPNIKIKLGLDKILNNKPVINVGVDPDNPHTQAEDFVMLALTGKPFTTTQPNNADQPLDIVDLIGKLIANIGVKDDTLSIVASRQLLTVLLSVLDIKLGEGSILPETEIVGSLNIMNPDPDKGFLELSLGLVGQGKDHPFLQMGVQLLQRINVDGMSPEYSIVASDFNPDNYINLHNLMETLVVSFEMGGRLQLNTNGDGFSLGEFLAKLLGDKKYIDPFINTVQIGSDLNFNLKANIDISGLKILESGEMVFDPTTLYRSEILLEIYDNVNGESVRILGIYYMEGRLYLKLSYFGLNDICLTNADKFIDSLIKGTAIPTASRVVSNVAGSVIGEKVDFEIGTTEELTPIRLGIAVVLSPYALTLTIGGNMLTNLVAGLLKLSDEQKIEFGDVSIGMDISDGIKLSFGAQLETIEIKLELGGLRISANPEDLHKIAVPTTDWVYSDASTLLSSLKIRMEASLGAGGKGLIDLSPLVTQLLKLSDKEEAQQVSIEAFINNLGLEGTTLNMVIEAELNIQSIAQSLFRITMYSGEIGNSNEILVVIYDGANNKLYLKTQLFGICDSADEYKELDITKLTGKNAFMARTQQMAKADDKTYSDANGGESSVGRSAFSGLFSGQDAYAQFINIIFVQGGIQLRVAQEALILLFQAFGADIDDSYQELIDYLTSGDFTLGIEGDLSIKPISINFEANLNNGALSLHLGLNNLYLGFGQTLDLSNLEAAKENGMVSVIDGFTSIGVDLSGEFSANISSGDASGEIPFDSLISGILGAVQKKNPEENPVKGIDLSKLGTLGLMFKVLRDKHTSGEAFPNFGGTLYYSIGGIIDISNIKNLYLTLKLGTTAGGNDVLDVLVRGSANVGTTGVDIYVNAENLLGVEKFVIKNVQSFILAFTNAGIRLEGEDPSTGLPVRPINRSGATKNLFAALTGSPKGTDVAFANAIVLHLASNYQEMGLMAPIQLDIAAGALYGILESLAGFKLGDFLEGHDVKAQLLAGGDGKIIELKLGLENFISISAGLNVPNLELNPPVPDYVPEGYTVVDETFSTLRFKIKAQISLTGDFKTDPGELSKNQIDLSKLIGSFLGGVELSALINLIEDLNKTMVIEIDIAINLKKLIAGDWTGIEGSVVGKDLSGNFLLGVYFYDGNLYLDLTSLNIGKVRIDNFAVFLGNMIGKSPSAAPKSAMDQVNSLPQAEREAVMNQRAVNAYINILLGNDNGVVLEITSTAIALLLSSLSVGGSALDGALIAETFKNILEFRLGLFSPDETGAMRVASLDFKIASYQALLEISSVSLHLKDAEVIPDDLDKWGSSFAQVGELSQWAYVRAGFNFGWGLNAGTKIDFEHIMKFFLSDTLGMLDIAPVLTILNEFGQDFLLEVEAKIHFGNLFRSGTLLPDLTNPDGSVNIDVLLGSELSVKLICTTGEEDVEVISVSFVGGTLYLDLSAFSIGKVQIPNAYYYFMGMFAPSNSPVGLAYALPFNSSEDQASNKNLAAENQNKTAKQISGEMSVLAAFININVSSQSVALHVGVAGLLLALKTMIGGKPIIENVLTVGDLYALVNPLGDMSLELSALTLDNILKLELALKEWNKDAEGNLLPSDRQIKLNLGLSSDFEIVLGDAAVLSKIINPGVDYQRLTDDATVGIATRIEFEINLQEGSIENIYKDPLSSLIGALLSDLALSIGIRVMETQQGIITLSVEANISVMDLAGGIAAGSGFDIGSISAKIEVQYNGKTYATLLLVDGDLFADLTLVGGPKVMIEDFMGLLSGGFSPAPRSASEVSAEGKNASYAEGDEGEEDLLPKLPISLELAVNGLFIVVKKAAFNTIFGLINIQGASLGDWEISDDIIVKLGLSGTKNPIFDADGDSFKLGASVAIQEGAVGSNIMELGLSLNGIGAQFIPFNIEKPIDNYTNVMEMDTIIAHTELELNLHVFDGGEVNLQKVIDTLLTSLNVKNPFGMPIAPIIKTEDVLKDTLRLELDVMINFKSFASGNVSDILNGIKVKAKLYSVERPDFFEIKLFFENSVAYIDATTIGLGKISLPMDSLLSKLMNSKEAAPAAQAQQIRNMAKYMDLPADATPKQQVEKALGVTELIFGKNGISAIVAYDTISTIVRLLGIPLGDYMDGVVAPSVEIQITDQFGFKIIMHLLQGDGSSNNPILQAGIGMVGQTTNVSVATSDKDELESFAPADKDQYIPYDELTVYLSINASISAEFLAGYIPLDSILDLLITGMKAGIAIDQTHKLEFVLNGQIGLDISKFLQKDPHAMYGALSLNYVIYESRGSEYVVKWEQTLAQIYITDEGVYVRLYVEALGLDLKVSIPDFNIPSLIWNLIEGNAPFAAENDNKNGLHQVENDQTTTVPFNAPLSTLLQIKQSGDKQLEKDKALDIIIALTSQELSVEISVPLLVTVLSLVGLELEDPQTFVESVFSSGKLAIATDPGFRIYFRMKKDPDGKMYPTNQKDENGKPIEVSGGGYVFELSLFHDTVISLKRQDYLKFAAKFTDIYSEEPGGSVTTHPEFGNLTFEQYKQDFLPFNLKKLLNGEDFDVIEDFLSTIGGKVEIELGVDFKKQVLNFDSLFQNEAVDTFFRIKIAEALSGAVRLTLEFDASLRGFVNTQKITLGVDAILNFEDSYGNVILSLMVRGGGSGVTSGYESEIHPMIYLYSEALGIPKIKINSDSLKSFANLNLNALLKSLGLNVSDVPANGSADSALRGAEQRGGLLDDVIPGGWLGPINVANLFDSISLQPGKLAIVLSRSILKDLLGNLFNFPFQEIHNLSVEIKDGMYLDISLVEGFSVKMNLSTLEVDLGGRNLFGKDRNEVQEFFRDYSWLQDQKWSFSIESELTVTDELVSLFSLAQLTAPLLGADIVLEAGEVLNGRIQFFLRGFIDFSNLQKFSLQLAMVSDGKEYANIMFVGDGINPDNSAVYLDLTGMGLVAIKLNIDVGGIVKNLLGSLATGNAVEESGSYAPPSASRNDSSALRPSADEKSKNPFVKVGGFDFEVDDTFEDKNVFGIQLLLLVMSSKDVSIALTGGLISSLIYGMTDVVRVPTINYIRVGYIENEMTGIEIVLNEEGFRFAYSFLPSTSSFGKDVKNPINPNKNSMGQDLTYSPSDIGVIQQLYFSLNMEMRITTKKTTEGGIVKKSDQLESIEDFIETLMKVGKGSVDFAPQTTSMIIGFDLQLNLNLADLNKTQLSLVLTYNDLELLGVYYHNNAVYANLSELGLVQAKISGLDIITLVLNLLGDMISIEGGLNVGDLINGILPSGAEGTQETVRTDDYAYSAMRTTPKQAAGDGSAGKIRVVITNDSIYIIPTMAAIESIIYKATTKVNKDGTVTPGLTLDLPGISEIRLGINLKEGLNNLSLSIKLDNYNNGIDIAIPAGSGLVIKINDANQKIQMPTSSFDGYGGITGINLSNGGISLNTLGLVSSLLDGLDAPVQVGIFLKKRNAYYVKKNGSSYVGTPINPSKDPVKNPTTTSDYSDANQATTSVGIVLKRDNANALHVGLDIATRNNQINVSINASKLKISLGRLTIKLLFFTINIGPLLNGILDSALNVTLTAEGLLGSAPPSISEVGSLSGTVTDENGEALKDANVYLTDIKGKVKETKTDRLGSYSFARLEAGLYSIKFEKQNHYEVLMEDYEIKDMQKLETAQKRDVTLISRSSSGQRFERVVVNVDVVDQRGAGIVGAEVYVDNIKRGTTSNSGQYSDFFDSMMGSKHMLMVRVSGYEDAEVSFDVFASNTQIRVPTIRMKEVVTGAASGTLTGIVKEESFNEETGLNEWIPVTGGYEIWLVKDGSTIREKLVPTNFATQIDTLGKFRISELDFGKYEIKIRSTEFENLNVVGNFTLTKDNALELVPEIRVVRRSKTHFTENQLTNAMIAGIRIRLGADKLDSDKNDKNDMVVGSYEQGLNDVTDSTTYIEAWLGENLMNGLIDLLHNLLGSGLSGLIQGGTVVIGTGYMDVSADKRYGAIELADYSDHYDEAEDIKIYDYYFNSRAQYLQYQTAYMTKFPTAFLQNILASLMAGLDGTLKGLIGAVANILSSTFRDLNTLIGHLFPFTPPYNMMENKELNGNPLKGLNDAGWLDDGVVTTDGRVLDRKVGYGEKSVYARIKLSQSNVGGMLESIKLFINGARYKNAYNLGALSNDFGLMYDNIEKTPIQTIQNGMPTGNKARVDEWLRLNSLNSFIVITDHYTDPGTGETSLWNEYYVRNMETREQMLGDDHMELDIINNGLKLKSARELNRNEFCNLDPLNGSLSTAVMLPEKIIFNNPYDISDFTVVGGTWASEAGMGGRNNEDKTRSPLDIKEILPNRNRVSFANGNSTGSNGAGVFWSLSVVDFSPEGGNYEIIGSCLNREIRIPCEVRARTIDSENILTLLKGSGSVNPVPDIDPYDYKESIYIDNLPKSFREGTQLIEYINGIRIYQTGKYVFNELSWDMSDVVITNGGGDYTATLTYGFAGGAKGKVKVPIKVLDRTVSTIKASVSGSVGGIVDNILYFDPFKITADEAREALYSIPEVYAQTVSGEFVKQITPRITQNGVQRENDVNLGSFRTVNFDNLDYNNPSSLSYTIYINLRNSAGEVTAVPVTVKILNKNVVSTSLADLTEEDRTIKPFRKGGLYDKNTGLNLPNIVELNYSDGSVGRMEKGINYIWALVEIGTRRLPNGNYEQYEVLTYEGKNGQGIDNWFGKMSTDGGQYKFRMCEVDSNGKPIAAANDSVKSSIYEVTMNVQRAKVTSASQIEFWPYENIRLPGALTVGFNGGTIEQSEVNVRWGLTESDIFPSFTGALYFSDLEVYDALFVSEKMVGAEIIVRQVLVNGVEFTEKDFKINPFFAAEEIARLLSDSGTTLTIQENPNIRITKDNFDIIDWKITNASRSKVAINLVVGNKGYATNPIWKQQRVINNLKVIDMMFASVEPIEIESVYDGMPQNVKIVNNGIKYNVPVNYMFDSLPNGGKDFYRTYDNWLSFSPKNLPGEVMKVNVLVTENKGQPIQLQGKTFVGEGDTEIGAFENVWLPSLAALDFGGGKIRGNIPVVWDRVEGYTLNGGTATFYGRSGKPETGYVDVEYTVNLISDEIGSTDFSDKVITIDPLKDLASQLKQYSTVQANIKNGTAVLDVEFPMNEILMNWQGSAARPYIVKIGRRINLTDSKIFVYNEVPVMIEVQNRKANGIQQKFVGHIYQETDFSQIKEVTVVFEGGQLMTSKVSSENWSGIGSINYSKANTYNIQLTVFADNPLLRQVVEIGYVVKSAVLVEAYRSYENGVLNDKVNLTISDAGHMLVNPFVGFGKLPERLYGVFDGIVEPILMNAEWRINHIISEMSINGGTFTAEKLNSGRVTLFGMKNGERVRPQQLLFDVEVENCSVQDVEFSYDRSAGQNEGTFFQLNDKPGDGIRKTDGINPYNIKGYSDNPLSDNFLYYRSLKVILKNGQIMYFNGSQLKYNIYDEKTGMPVVLSNLYKGRDMTVKIELNRENIRDEFGNQILASDAAIDIRVDYRIFDMTYSAGGGIPSDYNVDLYADYFNEEGVLSVKELLDRIFDITIENNIIYGTEKLENGEFASHVFNNIKASKDALNINYLGQTGYIHYSYGNDVAGYQTVAVPVQYKYRELVNVINKESTPHFYKNDNGLLKTEGAIDPHMFIDLTKEFVDGFLYDPFGNYTLESFFKNLTKIRTVTFRDESGVLHQVSSDIVVDWTFDRVFIDIAGGTFSVRAKVTGDTSKDKNNPLALVQEQVFTFRVLNRKVKSATSADDPIGTDLANQVMISNTIRAYDFADAMDVDAAVRQKHFKAGAEFTVQFREGYEIQYKLGAPVTTLPGNQPAGELVPENPMMKMQFNIDSLKPLNSQGKDIRFVLTIPGYGMGGMFQQNLYLYAKSVVQNITGIQTWAEGAADTDSSTSLAEYFKSKYKDAINKVGTDGERFEIPNPYVFIKDNGLQLPTKVRVILSSQDASGNYDTCTINGVSWQGTRLNKLTIPYLGGEFQPSFSMPVDNRKYTFQIKSASRIVNAENGIILDHTTVGFGGYSFDEIIPLPITGLNAAAVELRQNSVANEYATQNYGYSITFQGGFAKEEFTQIRGGGNYRDNYNKWDFSEINFNDKKVQYAKMTLGGKGGQQVLWALKTTDKRMIGTSQSTLQIAEAGVGANFDFSAGDTGTLGGKHNGVLPVKFYQYFSDGTKSAAVPVEYGSKFFNPDNTTTIKKVILDFSMRDPAEKDDVERTQPNFYYSNGAVLPTDPKKATIAPRQVEQNGTQVKSESTAGALEWRATELRAYPGNDVQVEGKMVFALYPTMSEVDNSTIDAELWHPDNTAISHNDLTPGMSSTQWMYPTGLNADLNTSNTFAIPKFELNKAVAQNDVPMISLMEGSQFDTYNLPLLDMQIKGSVQTYLLPWHLATVYEQDMTLDGAEWKYNGKIEIKNGMYEDDREEYDNIFNKTGNQYNLTVPSGIKGINTAKVGMRYTLVLDLSAGSKGNIKVIVAISIVR